MYQIPPCTECKCHTQHYLFKKKTTAKEEGLYSSSPETEKPKETSPLFAQFSATPSLQWISACSEDALDGVRYSPELSRFSWELETEI